MHISVLSVQIYASEIPTMQQWLDLLQAVGVICSLAFVAYQSWLMRRALEEQRNAAKVQSYLQVWMNHIQTNHLPIAFGSAEQATLLNALTPYHGLEIKEAQRCHFADAVFDLYECIQLLSESGILTEEVARVWRASIPYEMRNSGLRAHWQKFHGDLSVPPGPTGALGIYHRAFMDVVNQHLQDAAKVDRTRRGDDQKESPRQGATEREMLQPAEAGKMAVGQQQHAAGAAAVDAER